MSLLLEEEPLELQEVSLGWSKAPWKLLGYTPMMFTGTTLKVTVLGPKQQESKPWHMSSSVLYSNEPKALLIAALNQN